MKSYQTVILADLERNRTKRSTLAAATIEATAFEDGEKLYLDVIVKHDGVIVENRIFEVMRIPK